MSAHPNRKYLTSATVIQRPNSFLCLVRDHISEPIELALEIFVLGDSKREVRRKARLSGANLESVGRAGFRTVGASGDNTVRFSDTVALQVGLELDFVRQVDSVTKEIHSCRVI